MQKDFTSEGLRRIIANAPIKKSEEQEVLVTRLFNEIEPYLSKGITTAEEELDFCSFVMWHWMKAAWKTKMPAQISRGKYMMR